MHSLNSSFISTDYWSCVALFPWVLSGSPKYQKILSSNVRAFVEAAT